MGTFYTNLALFMQVEMVLNRSMPKGNGAAIPKITVPTTLSDSEAQKLLSTLQERFTQNMQRHKGLDWADVASKLANTTKALKTLHAMEATGGEPDVIGFDKKGGMYTFCDCSSESPEGRRSICYDQKGEDERNKKGVYPAGNAQAIAEAIGVELLDEEQYRALQQLGEFDSKTSSWIKTPIAIRDLGGALFCDRRFDTVFVYHNTAPSFYGARGFRGMVQV